MRPKYQNNLYVTDRRCYVEIRVTVLIEELEHFEEAKSCCSVGWTLAPFGLCVWECPLVHQSLAHLYRIPTHCHMQWRETILKHSQQTVGKESMNASKQKKKQPKKKIVGLEAL